MCINTTELNLAILDVMMAEIDGFALCQKIREKYTWPIIMLTAKDKAREAAAETREIGIALTSTQDIADKAGVPGHREGVHHSFCGCLGIGLS